MDRVMAYFLDPETGTIKDLHSIAFSNKANA